MIRRSVFAIAGIVVLAAAFTSGASQGPGRAPGSFRTLMEGRQETPAISTEASGEFRATLNPAGTLLDFRMDFEGTEGGNTLFAHIHIGQTGVAGGVMAFLCGGGGKPACPNGGGTITGTIDASNVQGPAGQGISAGEFDAFVRAMQTGLAYANLHTVTFPAGEIRGQIEFVRGARP